MTLNDTLANALSRIDQNEKLGRKELTLESSWRNPDRQTRVRPHVDLCLAVCAELAAA